KLFRTIAFSADTTTASRISHASRLPVHFVNASIPRLNFRSDCNDGPPIYASAVLIAPSGAMAYPAGWHEAGAPFQWAKPPSIGSLLMLKGKSDRRIRHHIRWPRPPVTLICHI